MEEKPRDSESGSEQSRTETGENITAPSIGPDTVIEHTPPEERLAGHDHDTTDARGLDKRRQVKGGSYGPSNQRVIMRFVIFFALVAVALVGLKLGVDQLDKPPSDNAVQAPWAQPNSPQPKAQDPLSPDSPGADPRNQTPVVR
jgi:hypothetical protein